MSCIVHVFATAPDLPSVPDAAPWPVIARQLGRELVAMLNGDGDRGVRFLPLIGTVDGRRGFVEPARPLPPATLVGLFEGSFADSVRVDGELTPDHLRVRCIDATSRAESWSFELPFDVLRPWPALRRVAFELAGVLGIAGVPAVHSTLERASLARWFEARDLLLALQANLVVPDVDTVLTTGRAAVDAAPRAPACRRVLLDLARELIAAGVRDQRIAATLDAIDTWEPVAELIEAARLAQVGGGMAAAIPLWQRVAARDANATEALVQAAMGMFEAGRIDDVHALLDRAVRDGNRSPELRAQLAAVAELRGELQRRDELLTDLRAEDLDTLPPRVLRLLASWHIDRGECEAARPLLDRIEAVAPELPGLWLERGRASLACGDALAARRALHRCLELNPSGEARDEARRLLRFSNEDGFVADVGCVEARFAADDPRGALRAARRLTARRPTFAESWLLLGLAHERLGNLWRAERAFRRALRLDPHSAESHHRLGVVLARRRRPEQGFTHLRYAVELGPTDGSTWLHFAQLAACLGRRDEARRAIARAATLGVDVAVLETARAELGEA